jgi:hypothetical protein
MADGDKTEIKPNEFGRASDIIKPGQAIESSRRFRSKWQHRHNNTNIIGITVDDAFKHSIKADTDSILIVFTAGSADNAVYCINH